MSVEIRGGQRISAVAFPRLAIGLASHVRERVQSVVREQRDLIDRNILGSLAFFMEDTIRTNIPVSRCVEFSRIALQRMGAELLDINGYRGSEALRTQNVKAHRAFIGTCLERKSIFFPGLVACDKCVTVLNCRSGTRKNSYSLP